MTCGNGLRRSSIIYTKYPVIRLTGRLSQRRIDLDVERLYGQAAQKRHRVVAGKLVRTMDGLEIPVRPEDVVLKHRYAVWMSQSNVQNEPIVAVQVRMSLQKTTRHRASTSMYSLTFRVRVTTPRSTNEMERRMQQARPFYRR